MEFFANPWFMAAGGALISSPILIHLINRMRFKRIRWAAMEFLLKSQKRNRRRLIIEQLILLLLRILLVLLAAFLLARFLYSGEQEQSGTKHLVIVDDSLSMSDHWKKDGGKYTNSFVTAREELVRVATEASKANTPQEMTVYLLSDLQEEDGAATPIFSEKLNSGAIKKLNETLEKTKPTSQHLSPGAGIAKCDALLVASPHGQKKILHYFGDFRDNKWTEATPEGKQTIAAIDKTIGDGIHVSLLDVAHPPRGDKKQIDGHDNLAITDMRAETRIVAEGVPVEFTITLHNFSPSSKKTFLKVFVDGVQDYSASKPTENVPGGGDLPITFSLLFQKKKQGPEIRPGDSPEVREQKRRADQEFIHISAEIDLEETGLGADNMRDLVVEIRKKVPALLVDGNDGKEGTSAGGDVEHIEVALMAARAYEVERCTVEDLEKVNFSLYPSIYLLNVREIKSEAVIAKLAAYVKNGGSLAYFLGPKTYVPFYNEKMHKEQKGLFPVLLAPQPTPAMTDEERDERRKKDEQPKILFRYRPIAGAKPPSSSDPDSIAANLALQQSVFRYLLIERYHPARPRFEWDTDPNEKVRDVILQPNRNSMDVYKAQAQTMMNQALDLTADLVADEKRGKEFEKYEKALSGTYKREVTNALGTPYLFNLATAFDRTLKDTGDEKDEKRPNMTILWAEPTMKTLKEQIERFIETVRYGDPLVVARPYGKGRIVACLTTAGTGSKWNDWGGGSSATWTYPMFIMDLQRYLSSTGDDLNRPIGDKIEFELEAAKYKAEVTVMKNLQPEPDAEPKLEMYVTRKPVTGKEPLPERVQADGNNMLDFKATSTKQAGLYSFTFTQLNGDVPEQRTYAFNVDASSEGDLKRAERDKLERKKPGEDSSRVGKISLLSMGESVEKFKNKAPDASESPWLYLLILVVLIVEQALAVHLSFHTRGDPAPAAA